MTNQEAFDRNWEHFITKRNPPSIQTYAVGEEISPRYRSAVGACAVGILMTDETYNVAFEGRPVHTLMGESMVPIDQDLVEPFQNSMSGVQTAFLGAIQHAHDGFALLMLGRRKDTVLMPGACETLKVFRQRHGEDPEWITYYSTELRRIAEDFNLKVPA